MNNNICILSDFDGTITEKDGLYTFIKLYAKGNWEEIEQLWVDGKISSKECLTEEFKLIPNLSEKLICDFIQTMNIDSCFTDFYNSISELNIDFYIVSDGLDYFIEKILNKYNLNNLKIISNHAEFEKNKFNITFPNDFKGCVNNAGTCKCKILTNLRKKYEKIIYIGDGTSDFCVSDKADILFAKSGLAKFASEKNIKYFQFNNFSDIKKTMLNIT